MPKYRLTVGNGTDRQYNVSGDSIAMVIDKLKKEANWETWESIYMHYGFSEEEIQAEKESGFFYED